MILGRRGRNSGHFPKLDVKTVDIPDESVNDDLFPLFLSFHGLNTKKHAPDDVGEGGATESQKGENHFSEDYEGGDAGEEEDDVVADDVDDDVFDILEGTGLLNAHTRPHVGNLW